MSGTDQSPEANPGDYPEQAALRARVEEMMAKGRIRNKEGERVAALPESLAAEAVREALRKEIDEDAVLVLHDDSTVTWEPT